MSSTDIYAAALVLAKRFLTCDEKESRRKTIWLFLDDDAEVELDSFASEVARIDALLSGAPEVGKFSETFSHLQRKLLAVAPAVKPLTVRFGIDRQQSSDTFMNAELHGFRRALVVGTKAALIVEREYQDDARRNKRGYSSFAVVFFHPRTDQDESAVVLHFANETGNDFARGGGDLPAPRWRKCRTLGEIQERIARIFLGEGVCNTVNTAAQTPENWRECDCTAQLSGPDGPEAKQFVSCKNRCMSCALGRRFSKTFDNSCRKAGERKTTESLEQHLTKFRKRTKMRLILQYREVLEKLQIEASRPDSTTPRNPSSANESLSPIASTIGNAIDDMKDEEHKHESVGFAAQRATGMHGMPVEYASPGTSPRSRASAARNSSAVESNETHGHDFGARLSSSRYQRGPVRHMPPKLSLPPPLGSKDILPQRRNSNRSEDNSAGGSPPFSPNSPAQRLVKQNSDEFLEDREVRPSHRFRLSAQEASLAVSAVAPSESLVNLGDCTPDNLQQVISPTSRDIPTYARKGRRSSNSVARDNEMNQGSCAMQTIESPNQDAREREVGQTRHTTRSPSSLSRSRSASPNKSRRRDKESPGKADSQGSPGTKSYKCSRRMSGNRMAGNVGTEVLQRIHHDHMSSLLAQFSSEHSEQRSHGYTELETDARTDRGSASSEQDVAEPNLETKTARDCDSFEPDVPTTHRERDPAPPKTVLKLSIHGQRFSHLEGREFKPAPSDQDSESKTRPLQSKEIGRREQALSSSKSLTRASAKRAGGPESDRRTTRKRDTQKSRTVELHIHSEDEGSESLEGEVPSSFVPSNDFRLLAEEAFLTDSNISPSEALVDVGDCTPDKLQQHLRTRSQDNPRERTSGDTQKQDRNATDPKVRQANPKAHVSLVEASESPIQRRTSRPDEGRNQISRTGSSSSSRSSSTRSSDRRRQRPRISKTGNSSSSRQLSATQNSRNSAPARERTGRLERSRRKRTSDMLAQHSAENLVPHPLEYTEHELETRTDAGSESSGPGVQVDVGDCTPGNLQHYLGNTPHDVHHAPSSKETRLRDGDSHVPDFKPAGPSMKRNVDETARRSTDRLRCRAMQRLSKTTSAPSSQEEDLVGYSNATYRYLRNRSLLDAIDTTAEIAYRIQQEREAERTSRSANPSTLDMGLGAHVGKTRGVYSPAYSLPDLAEYTELGVETRTDPGSNSSEDVIEHSASWGSGSDASPAKTKLRRQRTRFQQKARGESRSTKNQHIPAKASQRRRGSEKSLARRWSTSLSPRMKDDPLQRRVHGQVYPETQRKKALSPPFVARNDFRVRAEEESLADADISPSEALVNVGDCTPSKIWQFLGNHSREGMKENIPTDHGSSKPSRELETRASAVQTDAAIQATQSPRQSPDRRPAEVRSPKTSLSSFSVCSRSNSWSPVQQSRRIATSPSSARSNASRGESARRERKGQLVSSLPTDYHRRIQNDHMSEILGLDRSQPGIEYTELGIESRSDPGSSGSGQDDEAPAKSNSVSGKTVLRLLKHRRRFSELAEEEYKAHFSEQTINAKRSSGDSASPGTRSSPSSAKTVLKLLKHRRRFKSLADNEVEEHSDPDTPLSSQRETGQGGRLSPSLTLPNARKMSSPTSSRRGSEGWTFRRKGHSKRNNKVQPVTRARGADDQAEKMGDTMPGFQPRNDFRVRAEELSLADVDVAPSETLVDVGDCTPGNLQQFLGTKSRKMRPSQPCNKAQMSRDSWTLRASSQDTGPKTRARSFSLSPRSLTRSPMLGGRRFFKGRSGAAARQQSPRRASTGRSVDFVGLFRRPLKKHLPSTPKDRGNQKTSRTDADGKPSELNSRGAHTGAVNAPSEATGEDIATAVPSQQGNVAADADTRTADAEAASKISSTIESDMKHGSESDLNRAEDFGGGRERVAPRRLSPALGFHDEDVVGYTSRVYRQMRNQSLVEMLDTKIQAAKESLEQEELDMSCPQLSLPTASITNSGTYRRIQRGQGRNMLDLNRSAPFEYTELGAETRSDPGSEASQPSPDGVVDKNGAKSAKTVLKLLKHRRRFSHLADTEFKAQLIRDKRVSVGSPRRYRATHSSRSRRSASPEKRALRGSSRKRSQKQKNMRDDPVTLYGWRGESGKANLSHTTALEQRATVSRLALQNFVARYEQLKEEERLREDDIAAERGRAVLQTFFELKKRPPSDEENAAVLQRLQFNGSDQSEIRRLSPKNNAGSTSALLMDFLRRHKVVDAINSSTANPPTGDENVSQGGSRKNVRKYPHNEFESQIGPIISPDGDDEEHFPEGHLGSPESAQSGVRVRRKWELDRDVDVYPARIDWDDIVETSYGAVSPLQRSTTPAQANPVASPSRAPAAWYREFSPGDLAARGDPSQRPAPPEDRSAERRLRYERFLRRRELGSRRGDRAPVRGAQKASNKQLVKQALEQLCLAGPHCEDLLSSAQTAVDACDGTACFVILLADNKMLSFKGVYVLEDGEDCSARRIFGPGPRRLDAERVQRFFRYNSAARMWREIPATAFGATTDAVAIETNLLKRMVQRDREQRRRSGRESRNRERSVHSEQRHLEE